MKTRWLFSLTCVLALGTGAWLSADDDDAEATDETAAASAGEEVEAKPEEEDTYCQAFQTAAELIAYGRENNAPEALICAARILGTTPTTEHEPDSEEFYAVEENTEELQGAPTAEDLLAEAAEMSDAEHIQTLIAQVTDVISEAEKGGIYGPDHVFGCVHNGGYEDWHGDFYIHEWAEITIVGDGVSDLDITVTDEYGYVVAQDNSYSPNCYVSWYPHSGHFHIEVHCHSSPYNHVHYTLYHN
jgi:hypothetical protein